MHGSDTIAAVATGTGGAISVVRISGPDAIAICDGIFRPVSGTPLSSSKGYTLHYGNIVGDDGVLDDVIVSLYRCPASYTGEDMVEISCHGSPYIRSELMKLLIARGARTADAGEFTIRAFLAGKIDLSQAEAISDMIASHDKASHALASNQMRGGYSDDFSRLREQLVELVSLLELELDFGEEDVQFADRARLLEIITAVQSRVSALLDSFSLGNAIKNGVPVAIVGKPNVGKSTLLNALLKEDRAMVSDIAGTTRDVIEETVAIGGVTFRFIDTAGIRETGDALEQMGIERTHGSIGRARIVLLLIDASTGDASALALDIKDSLRDIQLSEGQLLGIVLNKADKRETQLTALDIEKISAEINNNGSDSYVIYLSAKQAKGLNVLMSFLSANVHADVVFGGDTVISNSRHYEALLCARDSLQRALGGLTNDIPSDLLSQDIRQAIHHIGTITGEITTDEILGTIFSKFCIGK